MNCLACVISIFVNAILRFTDANYTIYLYVSSIPGSGSASINYLTLTGDKGSSPKTPINTFPNGSANPNVLVDGQLTVIPNKFPSDYGYISVVSIGNTNDNLTMQALNIFDVFRNLWSNMSFNFPFGGIQAGSSIDILYPVTGGWSDWSLWGACSATCGNGTMNRQRICTNPVPANGGALCKDSNNETQSCFNNTCPMVVNGGWTEWSNWGSCSVTCGNGNLSRQRMCTNPIPTNGGTICNESGTQWMACSVNPCAINGGWSDWSQWGNCSVFCGNGVMSRTRNCTNPIPANGGSPCNNSYIEWMPCQGDSCPDPDPDYVPMELFNSTMAKLTSDIFDLKTTILNQRKEIKFLKNQLNIISTWGMELDMELVKIKRFVRKCSNEWDDETNKNRKSLSQALKSRRIE